MNDIEITPEMLDHAAVLGIAPEDIPAVIAKNAADLAAAKEAARALADEFKELGFDVFMSYGHGHGLTEWDVYQSGNGTAEGMIGSIWYDGFGIVPKGDALGALLATGKFKNWPMD